MTAGADQRNAPSPAEVGADDAAHPRARQQRSAMTGTLTVATRPPSALPSPRPLPRPPSLVTIPGKGAAPPPARRAHSAQGCSRPPVPPEQARASGVIRKIRRPGGTGFLLVTHSAVSCLLQQPSSAAAAWRDPPLSPKTQPACPRPHLGRIIKGAVGLRLDAAADRPLLGLNVLRCGAGGGRGCGGVEV